MTFFNSPQFLAVAAAFFLALSGYNLLTGFKRVRAAAAHGVRLKWRKQINLLTGTEYLLLALVFLLSIETKNNAVPKSVQGILIPVYLFLLLAAAVLAGFVIRQGIFNTRMLRAQQQQGGATTTVPTAKSNGNGARPTNELEDDEPTSAQERAAAIERRRERRRNAAAARRRRAGKA